MNLCGLGKRHSTCYPASGASSPIKRPRPISSEIAGFLEAKGSEAHIAEASHVHCGRSFFRGILGLMSRQGRLGFSVDPPPKKHKETHVGHIADDVTNENVQEEMDEDGEHMDDAEEESEAWSSDYEEDDDSSDDCYRNEDDNEALFEIGLEDGWQPFDAETCRRIAHAGRSGWNTLEYRSHGRTCVIDLQEMRQTNLHTGVHRPIRCCKPWCGSSDPREIDDGDAVLDLQPLHALLRQLPPAPPRIADRSMDNLDAQQIVTAIERFVPEAKAWIAPRSNGTPALDFLVRSYTDGLPAFPLAVRMHLAQGVRVIMGAIWDPEKSGISKARAKSLAHDLAEAFTSCQAVQARTIDALQAEVRGMASHSLATQLRSLIEEHRELALDRTVCYFHPRALMASDANPRRQLPHLVNRYRRHLGHSAGLMGGPRAEAAASDKNARGPLPVSHRRAIHRFWREFGIRELLRTIVADVNQTDLEADRRLDRHLIMAWAGSVSSVGHRIFYDEARPELYGSFVPSSEQLHLQQPVLYEGLAAELLLSVLGDCSAGGASAGGE
mmetsp:Transcript_143688/g.358160  ORF Transcript_143688/g.358160 Transcript_143688/m.358160 type:complete len:554 (+) Transcript_143688:104-1765(+)